MSGRLFDGELLRAAHVLGMSDSRETQEYGWRITIRLNGELIGHRQISPLISEPTVLLAHAVYDDLTASLDQLDTDYQPASTCDGSEFRSLTYLSNNRNRHISYSEGVSDDFDRFESMDEIWQLLSRLSKCQFAG